MHNVIIVPIYFFITVMFAPVYYKNIMSKLKSDCSEMLCYDWALLCKIYNCQLTLIVKIH